MKYNGKGEMKWIISVLFIFYQKLYEYTYLFSGTIGSKLIHHVKSSLAELKLLHDLYGWE